MMRLAVSIDSPVTVTTRPVCRVLLGLAAASGQILCVFCASRMRAALKGEGSTRCPGPVGAGTNWTKEEAAMPVDLTTTRAVGFAQGRRPIARERA